MLSVLFYFIIFLVTHSLWKKRSFCAEEVGKKLEETPKLAWLLGGCCNNSAMYGSARYRCPSLGVGLNPLSDASGLWEQWWVYKEYGISPEKPGGDKTNFISFHAADTLMELITSSLGQKINNPSNELHL